MKVEIEYLKPITKNTNYGTITFKSSVFDNVVKMETTEDAYLLYQKNGKCIKLETKKIERLVSWFEWELKERKKK